MSKLVLVVGNGAREHAIVEALRRSPQRPRVAVFANAVNPLIKEQVDFYEIGDLTDAEGVAKFGQKIEADFAVIGPEAPLAAGVVDALLEVDIHSVGPTQNLARLESSKSFTRDLLNKYQITGNPIYQKCSSSEELQAVINQLGADFVVKADGLRGGKGVCVSGDHFSGAEEGAKIALEYLKEDGLVVIEEKLIGQEFSLLSFSDGENAVHMPCAQDHKRAYEGDKGPNTGGMGAYTDRDHLLPFLKAEDVDVAAAITESVIKAIFEETGEKFKGILYGGFMVTKNGVRLIEYNARFGDPEGLNLLTLLESDFVTVCEAIMYEGLKELEVKFANKASVLKYLVPEGYPDNPLKNVEFTYQSEMLTDVIHYFGAVNLVDGKLLMTGSRAVALVGLGESIAEAEQKVTEAIKAFHGPFYWRSDIGTAGLIDERIKMMNELRN